MTETVIKNGLVFDKDCRLRAADLVISGERIKRIAPPGSSDCGEQIDARGCYVLPGLVDIHSHGCMMADFCDADAAAIERMLPYYAGEGVTSLLGTTMSFDEKKLSAIVSAILPYIGNEKYGAILRGINMEGPFISLKKRGAQNPEYIIPPDIGMFDRLYKLSEGNIKLVTLAPEVEGGIEFIRHASKSCIVSLGHTDADYETGCEAYRAGARNLTHLFNANSPFHQRKPGIIGAAADFASYVEINADGFNVHPAVIRASFSIFGADRMCIISDSMRGTGMPEGIYDLGGQTVQVKDGKSTLVSNGAIAGSVSSLANSCRVTIGCGVPFEDAVRASTINPARAAGLDDEVGSLDAGKRADVLIWDHELKTRLVLSAGRRVACAPER